MSAFSVITTNTQKFNVAQKICAEFNIELEQVSTHDIDEIQGEDAKRIIARKAADAYALVQKPVIVTDDSWIIPGLGGFPGAYMKSVSGWLTTDDWTRLLAGVQDRTIILRQLAAYQDEHEQVIFANDVQGMLLDTARNEFPKTPIMAFVSFDGGKTSVAQNFSNGETSIGHLKTVWHEVGAWLQARQS